MTIGKVSPPNVTVPPPEFTTGVSSVADGIKNMPSKMSSIAGGIITSIKEIPEKIGTLFGPIVNFISRILFPKKFREEMGKVFSERGEIERETGVTAGIAESRMFKSFKKRLNKGKITSAAYDMITRGGQSGVEQRYFQLKKNKDIIQIGDMIMTGREKYGTTGVKAIFRKKIAVPISEKVNEIKESVMGPIMSAGQIATMKAGEKAAEIKANLESNKKVQESFDDMKKFQGVVVNNFNKATSAISNSISNVSSGQQDRGFDFDLDPNMFDLLKGDIN